VIGLSFSAAVVAIPAAAADITLDPDNVGTLTIADISEGLSSGSFTCTELVAAYLDRVAAYDQQGPELNAIISVNPGALADAAAIDAKLDAGESLELATCVPIVIKDVINTVKMPTTYGSPLFAEWVPPADATIVADLEGAGAIILAKTNLDDFAAAVYGISSITGAMKNPYDLARTVGGSSGGSAAAIAAGYAPLAIGTDTGGSLRIPAALTGVVTIRPTLGLVSRDGMFPRALTQDTAGPLAASVEDAAFGLDLIAGYDPTDPATARSVGSVPAAGYAASAVGGRLDGVQIGLVTGGLAIWGDSPNGPVVALLREAAAELESLGATVVPLPAPPSTLLGSTSVITPESARDVDAFLATQGDDVPVSTFAELYESGAYTTYAKESFDREIGVDPVTLNDNLGYQRSLATRTQLQDWTLNQMAANELSAIAYPSSAQLADLIGHEQAGLFSRWSENTGFPAISVPMGYAQSSTGTSMPANVEFIGRAFAEPTLIGIADAYENSSALRVVPALPEIATAEPPVNQPSPTSSPTDAPIVDGGTDAAGSATSETLAFTGWDGGTWVLLAGGMLVAIGAVMYVRHRNRQQVSMN